MSSPIPPLNVRFVGNTDDVAVAIRDLTSRVQGLGRATRQQSQEAQAATRITADLAGRYRAAAGATEPFGRGLLNLKNQEIAAAQGAATLIRGVDPIAAKMSQAASGTELFASKLRVLEAQQRAQADQQKVVTGSTGVLARANGALLTSLKGLAAGYGAVRVLSFINDSIEAAAALHDLAQKTGGTVEALSVLEFVGRRNAISAEDLTTSYRFLANSLQNLRAGVPEAVKAYAALNLTWADLEKLTPDQQFLKVANAIAMLPDGLGKAASANDVFGRSGSNLIPLLNELAQRGFPSLAREAQAAGAVISTDAAAAADKFRDSLDDLKLAAAGATRSLVFPGLPQLTEFVKNTQREINLIDQLAAAVNRMGDRSDAFFFGIGPLSRQTPTGPVPFNPNIFALGTQPAPTITNIGHRAATLPTLPLDQEIKALAELRNSGLATEKDLLRIREIVQQLTTDLANAASVDKRAQIAAQIASLTKEGAKNQKELTDAERQHLELMKAEADEAGKLLKAESDRRQVAADAAREAGFRAALTQTGGVGSFDELFARQRAREAQPAPGTEPLTVQQQVDRDVANQRAATEKTVRDMQEVRDEAIDAFQNIGQSLRENVAGVLDELFDNGKVSVEEFVRAALRGIERVTSQLISAKALGGLQSLVKGSGVVAAPDTTGLTDQGLQQGVAAAADFVSGGKKTGEAAALAASAAQVTAASVALGSAAAGVSTGAAALSAGAAPVVAAGAAVTTGAGALTAAGAGVTAAAAAIAASAAALAAAAQLAAAAGVGGLARGGIARVRSFASGGVLARVSNGEWELPPASLAYYGEAFLDRIRRREMPTAALEGRAEGGPIRGPGTATSDSILRVLPSGTFIQPAHAVQYYGARTMAALAARRIPRFAQGGAALPIPSFAIGGAFAPATFELPTFSVPKFSTPSLPRVPDAPIEAGELLRSLIELSVQVGLEDGLVEKGVKRYNRSHDAKKDHVRLSAATKRARRDS